MTHIKSVIVRLTLTTIACALAVGAAQSRPMTLDDIAKIKRVASASVSPDGQAIAFIERAPRDAFKEADGEARTLLKVIRGDAEPKLYVGGDIAVSKVTWAPSSNALYYLGKGKEDKQNALFAIPLNGGASELICKLADERSIANFDIHPDGQRLALVSRPAVSKARKQAKEKGFDAKVYEESAEFQQVALVNPGDDGDCEAEALTTAGHIDSVTFSPDGNRLLAVVMPSPLVDDSLMQKRLRVLSLEGSELTPINNLGKLGQFAWAPDSTQISFVGVTDFNDPREGRLKIATAADGQTRTLFDGLQGHFQRIEWAGNSQVYALVHVGVESELWLVDLNTDQREVLIGAGDRVITDISSSSDGRTLALIASSPEHPPELFRWRGQKLDRLTNSNPWLGEIDFGRQEPVSYKASDGLDLQGIVVYPTNYRKGRRYPLIVYVHGGPEAHRSNGWLDTYSWPIQVMAAEGYAAFVPNYRGSTGRGVEFTKLHQHNYATPEFDDIVDGKNYLVAEGLVDEDKVGITGGSYGGYATAWSATALTEHYAAGVMFVGISNQISKFGTTDIAQEMHAVHSRAWPWDNWQWMLERSPIYHVQKSQTPLLILHGDADPRVHPEQSLEMYRYLKLAGQAPVRLIWYPKEKHGNRRAASQYDYSLRFKRWMDHYLKGPGGEAPAWEIDYSDRFDSDES